MGNCQMKMMPFKSIGVSLLFTAMLYTPVMASNHSDGLIFTGIGEFAIGYRNSDSTEDVGHDGLAYSGAGRFSVPLAKNFSIQLDIEGEAYPNSDEEDPQGAYLIGGHVSLRDPIGALSGFSQQPGEA